MSASGPSEWGKIAVSILVLGIFTLALFLVYRVSDRPDYHDAFILMLGTAAAGFTTATGFWLGSSYGSSKKTDALLLNEERRKPTA